jgi:hypothetical protein
LRASSDHREIDQSPSQVYMLLPAARSASSLCSGTSSTFHPCRLKRARCIVARLQLTTYYVLQCCKRQVVRERESDERLTTCSCAKVFRATAAACTCCCGRCQLRAFHYRCRRCRCSASRVAARASLNKMAASVQVRATATTRVASFDPKWTWNFASIGSVPLAREIGSQETALIHCVDGT